jgi:protein involved in polysaccharide export with SLBB domain
VKDPQVEVFIDQYYSREVAVVGMVQKPGLYSITSRSDTILDMIDQAGGMTDQASSRLLFIPATAMKNSQQMKLAKALARPSEQAVARIEPAAEVSPPKPEMAEEPDHIAPDHADSQQPGSARVSSLIGATDPIEIDLTSAARAGQLDIPARPGDTIIIPAAGEVMVDGWVANPGAFRIVPGMTALSAVTAAGGALFSQTAEVLRTAPDGSRHATVVDLSKIKSGTEEDVPVEAGDVVFVRRSVAGAMPYAFYELFNKFGAGMSVAAF